MPDFGNLVQKALYLGVGLASYAGEKASETFTDLPSKLQQLADEMVARGEMSTEEARRAVEALIQQSQDSAPSREPSAGQEPRRIEILDAEVSADSANGGANLDAMRQEVERLQAELRRLRDQAGS